MDEHRTKPQVLELGRVPDGVDPRTGMSLETLSWLLEATHRARPAKIDEQFMLWLNAMAGIASAFLRAGGDRAHLAQFERDGFFWNHVSLTT